MKQKTSSGQGKTLKKVLHYIRHYWFLVTASVLLAAVTVGGTLYLPVLSGQVIDRILGAGQVDFAAIRSIL